jgi:colanic acid/amylovoran biosynthesis protein
VNITIVNAHWNNRGDEAAHRPLWTELQRRYPGSKLTILFKDKKPITWFPNLPDAVFHSAQFSAPAWEILLTAITRGRFGNNPALKQTVQVLSQSDLIVYPPGGSVINDRFFWSKQLEYLTPFLCARLYGIPMVVAAPSMGPYEAQPQRRLRQWLLRTPQVFCVREDISRRYLEAIGIRDRIEVTTDLAFMDEVDAAAAERQLESWPELGAFLQAYPRVIGITISDFRWHVKLGKDRALSERIERTFRDMISSLTARGYGVLLIPQLFGNQRDYDDLQAFAGDGVHVMSDQPDTYAQQQVVSKLFAVIGMRYHSNIFAAKMGTPFVAIVYEEKMEGFLHLAGLDAYGIALDDLSFETLDERFRSVEKHYDALRERLRAALPEWRRRARRTVELLPVLP